MRASTICAWLRLRRTRSPGMACISCNKVGCPSGEAAAALSSASLSLSPLRSALCPSTVPNDDTSSSVCSNKGVPTALSVSWRKLTGTGWFSNLSSLRPSSPSLARSSSAKSLVPRNSASGLLSSLRFTLRVLCTRGSSTITSSIASAAVVCDSNAASTKADPILVRISRWQQAAEG